jgi:thioredoxin-like negative regulator of GroEL
MLLDGMSIDLILLQQEKRKVEEQKAKVEVEKQSKIDPFFENLIKLANENSDVMFKLETFYKINNQIYNKNES